MEDEDEVYTLVPLLFAVITETPVIVAVVSALTDMRLRWYEQV